MRTQYLGDGVYVDHDGYQLWLTTTGNKIALDPSVYEALTRYVARLENEAERRNAEDVE